MGGASFDPDSILSVLDRCSEAYTFPMLDNGYVSLAVTRLSLYRSVTDWAMVIELFGFSPRAGWPDTTIQTFASRLRDRDPPGKYVSRDAYDDYLLTHPHDEFRSAFPVAEGDWQDSEDFELVAEDASEVRVRGRIVRHPAPDDYPRHGITLEQPPRIRVFELCRYLADVARESVLATASERRVSVLPDMAQLLQIEEWHHPDVAAGERPSASKTFRQMAQVLATGDVSAYHPTLPPNTHWKHWPDGGTL